MRVCIENLRFQWLCRRLHSLGPRVLAEFISEVGAAWTIRVDIEDRLERYAALDPAVLAALGADRFPALPIHLVSDQGGSPDDDSAIARRGPRRRPQKRPRLVLPVSGA